MGRPAQGIPQCCQSGLLIRFGPLVTVAWVLGAIGGIWSLSEARGGHSPKMGHGLAVAERQRAAHQAPWSRMRGQVAEVPVALCVVGLGVAPVGTCGRFSRRYVAAGCGWGTLEVVVGSVGSPSAGWVPATGSSLSCCWDARGGSGWAGMGSGAGPLGCDAAFARDPASVSSMGVSSVPEVCTGLGGHGAVCR